MKEVERIDKSVPFIEDESLWNKKNNFIMIYKVRVDSKKEFTLFFILLVEV